MLLAVTPTARRDPACELDVISAPGAARLIHVKTTPIYRSRPDRGTDILGERYEEAWFSKAS
jgi:hypothetical protein